MILLLYISLKGDLDCFRSFFSFSCMIFLDCFYIYCQVGEMLCEF